MQTGVAKGLKVLCLFMIAEVSIRCQKKPRRLVYAVYRRMPPIHTDYNLNYAILLANNEYRKQTESSAIRTRRRCEGQQ